MSSTLLEAPVSSSTSWLDNILLRICVSLQLTQTQHAMAEEHYLAVSKWLGRDDSPLAKFRPNIFPQGSLRIQTTVRPWFREEFDLDLVLWLALGAADPVAVLNLVEAELLKNGTYRPMVERMNRCIRLNFAGQFHMDILPARPDVPLGGDFLLVPDRNLHDWKESNPKGYAAWFETRSFLRAVMEKAATVEPLPRPQGAENKTALQLVVQLLKRWRYIRFMKAPDLAPISIVLTTLAGQHYAGEAEAFDALRNIVSRINRSIPASGRLRVCNPAHPEEDLSERWDKEPAAYRAFVDTMRELESDLIAIERPETIATAKKRLENLFGDIVERAVREQTIEVEKARDERKLGVTRSGLITTIAGTGTVPVKPHTFYGS